MDAVFIESNVTSITEVIGERQLPAARGRKRLGTSAPRPPAPTRGRYPCRARSQLSATATDDGWS